ncbi:hypothetical protein [Streptomyces cacaoi]|uniref:hypothetical protein n=1 Tax=Streptomyces cacaoi TaxID=1898 RepID=UPI0011F26885|nr:hypothetical protein [Streptomyces cacaoi]
MNAPPPADRRQANRLRHWKARQAAQAARGARGIASSWWDQARAVATQTARAAPPEDNPDEVWNDLALTLENWCRRYGR